MNKKVITRVLALLIALPLMTQAAFAAGFSGKVGSKYTVTDGGQITYGSGSGGYSNSRKCDLGDDLGSRYSYCVQPAKASPATGTVTVDKVLTDDDDKGKWNALRNIVYYSPSYPGYDQNVKNVKSTYYTGNFSKDWGIAHMALSYVYAGRPSDMATWGGTSASDLGDVWTKAKKLGDALWTPDSAKDDAVPDSFKVFIAYMSGVQDMIVGYLESPGYLEMTKSSNNTKVTELNACYSLEGAVYTVYDSSGKEVGKLTVKKDGKSNVLELPEGTYTVKETKAPEGYALNKDVKTVKIKSEETTSFSDKDTPIMNIVNLLLTKKPGGYPHNHGEGDAGLAGAVYRFNYYDGHYASASAAEGSGKPTAQWFFITDAKGEIAGANPKVASGYTSSELYKDKDGKVAFPLGTYVIQEVSPSTGYLLSNEKVVVKITEDGTDKDHVKTYNEKADADETIIRGGVELAKIDNDLDENYAQGDASLAGAEFTIYNKSKESIMIAGNEVAKDGVALVIATNADGFAGTDAHALPYGTYLVKETKPSPGYLLNTEWSKTFSIREDGKIIDLKGDKVREAVQRSGVQIVKRDKEIQKSEALGGANLKDIVFTIKNVSAHDVVVRKDIGNTTDKVDWQKLTPKKELFESGAIKRVKSGGDVGKIVTHWNEEKKAYTAETLADDLPYGTYTIRESKTNNTYQRTDKTEHKFEVREDGTVYAYDNGLEEILTFDDYVYRSDMQGTKIGDGDSKRFSFVPFKITSVSNNETHVVVADKNGFFSTKDRRTKDGLDEDEDADNTRKLNPFDDLLEAKDIKKADLEKRSTEILMGVWFGTGEFGTLAEMNPDFGALPYDSYVIEEMPFDGNEGYTLQKFFFTVDEKSQNGFVDLETITNDIPEIGTKASVDGKNADVSPQKEITLVDTIEYKNLKKGETYTAKGKLIDKKTGEVIKDAAGKEVTAETTFEAKRANGKVKVEFKFDGSNMWGMDTVVFETLYDAKGHVIAKHEDKDDEGQTVTWKKEEKPKIGTTLTANGKKEVIASEKTKLVDEVAYEGLYTDQWYVITGTLMVKETGDPLVENGKEITVTSEPFKPWKTSGKQKIVFEINTAGLEGKELVAFETCYRLDGYKKGDDVSKAKKTVVGEHKDINDKGQTVKIIKPEEPEKPGTPTDSPKTGDNSLLKLYATFLGFAIAGLAAMVRKELAKRRKQAKEDK